MSRITLPAGTDLYHLKEIEDLAITLMDNCGLTSAGWAVKWDRAKKRAGQCVYDTRMISLSAPLLSQWTIAQCRDVILHEIAHALASRNAGHGPQWKAICRSIGADPTRTWGHFGEAITEPKYRGVCPNGHVHYRYRLRKGQVSCAHCNPAAFDHRYLIEWKRNS